MEKRDSAANNAVENNPKWKVNIASNAKLQSTGNLTLDQRLKAMPRVFKRYRYIAFHFQDNLGDWIWFFSQFDLLKKQNQEAADLENKIL